jgi:proteic killer suppression protein
MIKSFRHKGVEQFFMTGAKAGIQPKHAKRLSLQLFALNRAIVPEDMNLPGWQWHALQGEFAGYWAVSVNGNWRVTYTFEGKDAVLVDYQDYH